MKHRYYIGLECLQNTRANIQSITKSIQSPLNPTQDDKYKDFLTCSFKKQGFQASNGKMQFDHLKDFLSRYYTMNDLKVIEECKSVMAKTHGEIAFESMKCIMRKLVNLVEKGDDNNDI
ncbi:unnamed protein product [Acanthoscelides obtectus]|nr:unnamed protein product [Acanthoscelides obtectus]CAK1655202.1 hypothetical protein AOBTE_LOCUS19078 [Acanthoscelides obtectus]